ncbi:CopY family transcriptional regulator (plasmid) [Paenibacillus peoriae]|uniref:BlaI/MecI/CopY family transcriptional regulator n=1 Tax=Paenibacillus peoriae TaxID=59893 RepID=UPI00072200B5|nr:BlaI/MecI/CopY family transcriptional regulator [Paenibacillus peoriae]ALS09937.1 CopY family transcriptional regulator [Paenibacillus peoriae]
MNQIKKLSATEKELMEEIWTNIPSVTSTELLNIFAQRGIVWKAQTMATFLTRMEDKGYLTGTIHGRYKIYAPTISREEFKLLEIQHVLDELYQGSVKNLISAMYDSDKLSDKDINELKKWILDK